MERLYGEVDLPLAARRGAAGWYIGASGAQSPGAANAADPRRPLRPTAQAAKSVALRTADTKAAQAQRRGL